MCSPSAFGTKITFQSTFRIFGIADVTTTFDDFPRVFSSDLKGRMSDAGRLVAKVRGLHDALAHNAAVSTTAEAQGTQAVSNCSDSSPTRTMYRKVSDLVAEPLCGRACAPYGTYFGAPSSAAKRSFARSSG